MNAETLAPLTVETPWGRATLSALRCLLPDGRTGWYMRALDDCLRAAVATATQTRYENVEEIPNLGALIEWANEHGFEVDVHHEPPVHAARWIGVTPVLTDAAIPNNRHTVVMTHGRVYHDPAGGFIFADGSRPAPITELEHGLTLEKRSNA